MPELKCGVTTCAHNQGQYCDLDVVQVNGPSAQNAKDTNCDNFVQRTSGSYSNSTNTASPTSDIHCMADSCKYNCTCKCNAGEINVTGSNAGKKEETECSTFCQ